MPAHRGAAAFLCLPVYTSMPRRTGGRRKSLLPVVADGRKDSFVRPLAAQMDNDMALVGGFGTRMPPATPAS